MNNQTSTRYTSRLDEYNNYFSEVSPYLDEDYLKNLAKEKGIDCIYRIIGQDRVRAEAVSIERRGAIVHYRVYVGQFELTLLVLNLPLRGVTSGRKQIYKGSKSHVFEMGQISGKSYVCKRIYFEGETKILRFVEDQISWNIPINSAEIDQVVKQYGIAKLCSALGVGVKVGSPDHPFDLVCYQNFIEFFMEKCTLIVGATQSNILQLESRLKYCVAVIHHFGLIHKDIKPPNLLANSKGQAVLADFNISTHTTSVPGEQAHTERQGTTEFMSPAMFALRRFGAGYVDLFYNDFWGLKRSLQAILSESLKQEVITAEVIEENGRLPLAISHEDRTIAQLGDVYTSKKKQVCKWTGSQSMKKVIRYFNEFGEKVKEQEFDIELLVRVFGATPKLLFYLQQLSKHTTQTKCLLTKLLRRVENIEQRFTMPYLPHKLQLAKKAYSQALRELDSGDTEDAQESVTSANKLAIMLIEGHLADRLYEEALEVYQSIEPFITYEKKILFRVLRVNAELQKRHPDRQIIDSLLLQIDRSEWKLINGAMYCFERNNYMMSLSLLKFLFIDLVTSVEQPSAETILQTLEIIMLQPNNRGMEADAWRTIWAFYSLCSISLMRHHKVINIQIPFLQDLPADCRLQVSLSRANALRWTSRLKQSLKEIDNALSLSKQVFSEVGPRTVFITLQRCEILLNIQQYGMVQPILTAYLRYAEVTFGDNEWIVTFALRILSLSEFLQSHFQDCLRHLSRSLRIVQRMPFNTHFNIASLAELVIPLMQISDRTEFHNEILQAALLMEDCLRKSVSSNIHHMVLAFRVGLGLALIFSAVGDKDKSVKWEANSLLNLENVKLPQEAIEYGKVLTNFCRIHDRLFTIEKSFQFSNIVMEIVDKYREHCSYTDMLWFCQVTPYLRAPNTPLQYNSALIDYTLSLLKPEIDGYVIALQYQLTTTLKEIGRHEEAYLFLRHLTGKYSLSFGLAAQCLEWLGRHQQCELLYLQYLASNRDLSIYEEREMTFIAHNSLRSIYRERNNAPAHQYHFEKTLQAFAAVKPDHPGFEFKTIAATIKMYRTENCRSLELQCKRRLFEIATDNRIQSVIRWECYASLADLFYVEKRYRVLFDCLVNQRRIVCRKWNMRNYTFGLAYCCIILGKNSLFYRSAIELKETQMQSYERLLHFLNERKEFIKLYLIQAICPENCTPLKMILQGIIDHGLSSYQTQPLKRRLLQLMFTKRLRIQTLYRGLPADNVLCFIKSLEQHFQ